MKHPAFRKTALGAALALLTLTGSAAFAQTVSVELLATEDARTQGGTPDGNFPTQPLVAATQDGHRSFIQFDLSVLPLNATIDSADLILGFALNDGVNNLGPKDVEVGRADGPWDEYGVTWNTQPAVTWGGPRRTETVDATPDDYVWDITGQVRRWHDGTDPDYGVGVRGRFDADNTQKLFFSREAADLLNGPRLAITYTLVEPEDPAAPRPDLGDAPDSSNHQNIVNTAYPGVGIAGQFPTVHEPLGGQPAGPRHANVTGEAILGQYLSRELEADQGPDQDSVNNILIDPATGLVVDTANNDRGDDGWRNRNIRFYDCESQELVVRVTRAPGATRNTMFLNVWNDGNRDGDWQDFALCDDPVTGQSEASYEWIVQDHIIDISGIAPGGYQDFVVDTERMLVRGKRLPHWMRFTLSDQRAVQPDDTLYPDGRGPDPEDQPRGFDFGETEDVPYKAPEPPQQLEDLRVQTRVITDSNPVAYAGSVTYEVRLIREGGSGAMDVELRDELPYPLHLNRQIDDQNNVFYFEVDSSTGGVTPLEAELHYNNDSSTGVVTEEVRWAGQMDPDSEVVFSFEVHVHPVCAIDENTTTIAHRARARELGESVIESQTDFEAACPGYVRVSGLPNLQSELNPNLEPAWDVRTPRSEL